MTKTFNKLFLFRIGIFLLVSAPFIASILLVIASVSKIKLYKKFFKDNWNFLLIISSVFMIIGTIYINFDNTFILLNNQSWNSNLIILGLFNWIPFFWCFWSFQFFLKSKKDRNICAILLIAGTIPVLVSGFGQYLFDWHGPFETFFGLIIWYQREINTYFNSDIYNQNLAGMTSLFNNQNYAGAWLSIVFPFSLALIFKNKNRLILRSVSLFLFSLIFLGIIFTHSRSAFGSALITIILFLFSIFNRKRIKNFLLFILLIIISILVLKAQNLIPIDFSLSEGIYNRNIQSFDLSRKDIWGYALKAIIQRPLFGWGSGSFPFIFRNFTGIWKGHSHNIFLELFFSYGIFVGLAFIFFLKQIFFISFKKIFFVKLGNNNIIDKAWFCSSLSLILSH